jgi:hypothetical protein
VGTQDELEENSSSGVAQFQLEGRVVWVQKAWFEKYEEAVAKDCRECDENALVVHFEECEVPPEVGSCGEEHLVENECQENVVDLEREAGECRYEEELEALLQHQLQCQTGIANLLRPLKPNKNNRSKSGFGTPTSFSLT